MIQSVIIFLKGIAMGAANVIPGVSGGTIALITGIFERIIHAIKNTVSTKSASMFFTGKLKQWFQYTDFGFVIALGLGIVFAMISIARILEFLFAQYPMYVWAFFFGLVLASVWFVAKTIEKWNFAVIFFLVVGTSLALSMALLKPMSENSGFFYLMICGAIAACSMILPGLSGSFVLVLMGNYELVMIHSINEGDFSILIPVIIGAGIGLLLFSYLLSWIFKKFRNQTISLLSGFMFGSLLIIWPWKETIWKTNENGGLILSRSGDKIVESYNWVIPQQINTETFMGIVFIIIGIICIYLTELIATKKTVSK